MTRPLGILRGSFGRVALLDMNTSLVEHAHHHCHVILKISGPDQTFHVLSKELPVRDDTAVLVNSWEPHHYTHVLPDHRTTFLALYIEPRWLADLDGSLISCSRSAFFENACVAITDEIRRLRHELARRIEDDLYDDSGELESLTRELTLAIVHRFAARGLEGFGDSGRRTTPDFRIRRVTRYMRFNAHSSFALDELAKIAGLSRPHFNHLFRTTTGVSPGVFGNSVRVEMAMRALAERQGTIGALSDELGHSAQSNFMRFFQQHTGIAPSQFRRAVLQLG